MKANDIKYMIEATATDLAEMLSTEYSMGVEEALDTLYNSETYSKLINCNTGLYFQSSKYVFSFLKDELSRGKI